MPHKLTPSQIEALAAAYAAPSNLLKRGVSDIWRTAPMAIRALEYRGYVVMSRDRDQARLTKEGRTLIEANPERFGVAVGEGPLNALRTSPPPVRSNAAEASAEHPVSAISKEAMPNVAEDQAEHTP